MGVTPALPGVGRDLLRPLPHQPRGPPPGARLPQHLLLAARRDDLLDAFCEAAGVDAHEADHGGASSAGRRGLLKGFECLGACDIAPMASIDERYYGPLDAGRRPHRGRAAPRRRRGPMPDKALAKRRATAGGPEPEPDPRVREGEEQWLTETRMLFRHIDEPGLASIETYRRLGGYRALERALKEIEPDELLTDARGLRPARPRRRRLLDGQEGLVPAPRRDGQVPVLQRRRVRARGVQGPRADVEEPPPADRGDRRSRRSRPAPAGRSSSSAASTREVADVLERAVDEAYEAGLPRREHPRTRATGSSWSSTAAPAPTSAARRRRCSTRSRASAATRGSSRPSRRSRASTAGRR